MHIAHNYVMRSSTTWHDTRPAISSQEACTCMLVCYDQWWVSRGVGAIVNCAHFSCWEEAIAVPSVYRELVRKRGRQYQSANDARTFVTKRFHWKPCNKNLENTVNNPMTHSFRCINEVCSRFRGNRQSDTQTQTTTVTLPAYACLGLTVKLAMYL